ncbi:MAG TPA: serine hydrolase [Ramlibacter sp.]
MHWHFIAVALFVGSAAAGRVAAADSAPCGEPASTAARWSVEGDPASAGFATDALCDALRAFADSSRNLHGLVVERHGRVVAEAYRTGSDRSTYSLAAREVRFDADVLHDVRSVTKSVVALLWGIAEAEGVVPPVGTPVLDLLPDLADLRSGGRERITIADMLCMRSGLAWDESGGYGRWGNDERGLLWRSDRARYVFERPLAAPPGARFNYNGGLTAVLGLLLEERAGMSLQEYARRKLFEPLGVRDWAWVADLRGRTRAYTGLRLRPRDLARLGRLLLEGGRWQGRQLVPASWVQAVLAPCAPGGEYGYHWWSGRVWVDGKEVGWQGALGNGGQRLFLVPALDLAVVTTAGEYNDGAIGRVQRRLLEQVVAATSEHAGQAEQPAPAHRQETATKVETRATLRAVTQEDGGDRIYVHLKIVPGAKLPFTTLRFRVRDRALLAGLREGSSVKFRAERVDGENTLVAIRAVPPCERFQACD